MNEGALFYTYVGHGWEKGFDHMHVGDERYPILSGVPSLLPTRDDGRPRPDPRTPESFGLQWTTYEYGDHTWFKDLDLRVRELPAILDVPAAALRGRRILDAG